MGIYIKNIDTPKNCGECDDMFLLSAIGCDCCVFGLNDRPTDCPLTEVAEPSGDLISRADAVRLLVERYKFTTSEATEILSELPSAEVISHEEHVKELNDLAIEWKAKFAKAEKITDEIYAETMVKVAKECEECKERLWNIRPSAEAEWIPCSEKKKG